jgi:hypothetical protein
MTTKALLLALALWLGAFRDHALAYDPATTHAGLTERAVVASTLHLVLARRLGRPLGLFEPIALRAALLPLDEGRLLLARLRALDPAGGYRPGDDGLSSALGWIVAGSVVAWTPAEREQNSFVDPIRGSGLAEGGGMGGLAQSLRTLLDGEGLRSWATGTSFNLTGAPSTAWLQESDNDVGLPSFYDQLELTVAGRDRDLRNTALARTLLALGGVVAVLEDAGDPAHVRNDFRGAFLRSGGTGPFDRSSAFERYVADAYGIAGVPAAGRPISRRNAIAYLTDADRQGLADRTQRRFFSDGTLPEDGVVERDTTPQQIVEAARGSLVYGLPGLPRLELQAMGRKQYVYAEADAERQGKLVLTSDLPRRAPARRVLAYERVPGRVRFFLDHGVYEDTARALLPEVGAYAAGLIDHLLRGEVAFKLAGGVAELRVTGARGATRNGKLRVFAEDKAGARRQIGSWPAEAAMQAVSVPVPAGTRLIAAVLRAEDDAGVLVAVGEQLVP